MRLEEAKKAGAMALFGEKYPDPVRVVSMGQFSVELCGGTHLTNTGQVGFLKIVAEEPVAKGVRRVVAMTGPRALQRIRDTENLLKELVALLKTPQPEDLPRRVAVLQEELREAKKQLEAQTSESVAGIAEELFAQAEEVGRRQNHRPRHRRNQSRHAPRVHRPPPRQRQSGGDPAGLRVRRQSRTDGGRQ